MPGAGLPLHSAVHEKKIHRSQASWTKPVLLPIPGVQTRNFRLVVPNTPRLHYYLSRLGRRRGPLLLCFACMAMVMTVFTISKGFGGHDMDPWPSTDSNHAEPPTLVFRRADLQRIWEWEIASGNYPSRQSSASDIPLENTPQFSHFHELAQSPSKSGSTLHPAILLFHHRGPQSPRNTARHQAWIPLVQVPPR